MTRPAVLSLLLLACISTRTLAQADKGQAPYAQALGLHAEGKYEDALAKVKEALAEAPANKVYVDYQGELEPLAAQARFDSHALKAPPEAEKTLDSLAKYLVGPAKTDREKAQLIYRWVADRIAYDAEAYFSGKPPNDTAETVLARRKAVCAGYAKLFEALATRAGLEAVTVYGHAKGIGFVPGQDIKKHPHAWNAVKVDGKWQLLDSTWGAGDLNGKEFRKKYRPFFFLTPPARLVQSHFPDEAKWQLLDPAVSREDFARTPRIRAELYGLGVTDAQVKSMLAAPGLRDFVETLTYHGPRVTLRAAPLERHLKAGAKQRFEVEAPGFVDMAVVVNGKIERMKREGAVFTAEVTPPSKGDLLLAGRSAHQANKMTALLRYAVE